ncbi:MAG TPA: hypothetical protein VGQ76_24755 [Thermoanaerobaculia bacterium]|jgi:hypothetical protein|nr:hypothetical protein [Thermoanaerobaculia bacterium]
MFTRRLRVLSAAMVIAAVPLFGSVTRDGNMIVVTATPSTTVAWMLRDSDLAVRTYGMATDGDGDGVIRIDNPVLGSHSWWGGIDLTSGQMMQMRLYFGSPLYDAAVEPDEKFTVRMFVEDGGFALKSTATGTIVNDDRGRTRAARH